MSNFLSFVLVIVIQLWCVFQPALYANSMLIEQGLSNVVYEAQKEASLQGRYDDELYREIKDQLIEIHHFDPDKVQVEGTESLTTRGNKIFIEVTIPKPKTNVFEALSGESEPYHYRKEIMSEYVN